MDLDKQTKDLFERLSHTQDGEILREHVERLITMLGDVSTLDKDPIESRKLVIDKLNNNLLYLLQEKKPKDKVEEEEDYT